MPFSDENLNLLKMNLFKSPHIYTQQSLRLKGIKNARDLGGYEVAGGLHVKSGHLIRSAHVADAKPSDIAYLESLSIGVLVDFRKEPEKNGKVDKNIPGAQYISIPIDASSSYAAKATADELSVVTSLLGANTDNFIKALDAIDQQYGSLEGYLKGPMGLTDEDFSILRERYLE